MKTTIAKCASIRVRAALGLGLATAALTGCYVVPMDARTGQPMTTATMPAAGVAAPVAFTARLYPANEQASAYGMVLASVTSDLQGRGNFSAVIAGESFSGEATRKTGSGRCSGMANGTGSRGGYISCTYTMNSTTLGSGTCRLNNGAQFNMHVGG
ncbi:hypothetical protein [Ottowia sp.]|uniref:hypothetical protein n=1 Tax=Ottowia sp. TaxID=1898956 RepID=UPI003A8B8AC3